MNSPRKIEYKDYSMSSQLGQCSQRKLQNLSRRNFPDKHIKIIIKQMYAAILSVLFLVQFGLWFLEIVCGSEFYWHNVLTDSTLQARDWSCLGNLSIGTLLSVSGKLNTHIVRPLPQSATTRGLDFGHPELRDAAKAGHPNRDGVDFLSPLALRLVLAASKSKAQSLMGFHRRSFCFIK